MQIKLTALFPPAPGSARGIVDACLLELFCAFLSSLVSREEKCRDLLFSADLFSMFIYLLERQN